MGRTPCFAPYSFLEVIVYFLLKYMCVYIYHELYAQHRKFLWCLAKLEVTQRIISWETSGNHNNKEGCHPCL